MWYGIVAIVFVVLGFFYGRVNRKSYARIAYLDGKAIGYAEGKRIAFARIKRDLDNNVPIADIKKVLILDIDHYMEEADRLVRQAKEEELLD